MTTICVAAKRRLAEPIFEDARQPRATIRSASCR
jgi:hypothetical protein